MIEGEGKKRVRDGKRRRENKIEGERGRERGGEIIKTQSQTVSQSESSMAGEALAALTLYWQLGAVWS